MSRKRRIGRGKKIVIFVSSAALVGGIAVAMTGTSQASVLCDGLATALSNNQKFVAAQQANPDAQSAARIANRNEVIAQIQARQKAAGCTDGGDGDAAPAPATPSSPGSTEPSASASGPASPSATASATASASAPADPPSSDVVCPGSTVTVSGEGGAPAASSNQFPTGTKLKVTNLDNNKSATVSVTSTSGSCVLLNNAAFEQVREPGKFLIRRARIERVG
ncbi:hypothetical protein ACIRPT_26260 [Streptomyces sp. NPDC101227]|uniref:hypothetical protein n=1 Tax=Streptomyces sp. NPDC101227 TaxID=3366136 RepID=UPI00380AF9FA